jgi:hypothetical protein
VSLLTSAEQEDRVDHTNASSSSSFITPGEFTSQFQRHVNRQRPHIDSNAAGDFRHHKHNDVTNQQHHHNAAQLSLEEQSTARRELFATNTPVIKLRKSKKLYQSEMRRKLRNDEIRNSGNEAGETAVSSAPMPSKYIDVPLLPPAYLHQRALKHDTHKHVADDGDEDAERLQLAAARNALAQSDEPQLFRCLKCFHVFKAVPQTILRPKVQQLQLEVEEVQRNRQNANVISRNPRLRKRLNSVGRRRAEQAANPKGCPSCNSTRVQWAMEYIHHRTHHNVGASRP